jgi:hypothetical protein
MSTLTWLTEAVVRDGKAELDGKVLTRPALLVTDGLNVQYAVDVDIGVVDTVGYDQAQDLTNAAIVGTTLRNVVIARGNDALIYADVGAAVRLRRTASGRYEVVGFSQQMPGVNTRIPVDMEDATFGEAEVTTLTSRLIRLGEFAFIGGGFGNVPLGAIGVFRGSVLIEIRV